MSLANPAPVVAASVRHAWFAAAVSLATGVSLLSVLFQTEIEAALKVVIESPTFNHCFLILPVSAYLAWQRRGIIAATLPDPNPWIALAAIPVAGCWIMAERIGVMEGRQLMAMVLVQILAASVLGWRLWRALSAPLLYLFFLVPFGEYFQPNLQHFTVSFITAGLQIFGIPHFADGVTIEIPEGTFSVTEACAGLRFLIASLAFGAFYGCMMYRSPLRRVIFFILSILVPILANGIRALGIVLIGHYLGSAEAGATDHVLYGWLFFSLVTFLLIAIGLTFRQPLRFEVRLPSPVFRPGMGKKAITAVAAVFLIAAAPRVLANNLDYAYSKGALSAEVQLPIPSGCEEARLPNSPLIDISHRQVGAVRSGAYRCGADLFVLTLRTYPQRVGARPVFTDLRADLVEPGWDPITTTIIEAGQGGTAQVWSETEYGNRGLYAVVASALWIDGRPAHGFMARLRLALNSLRGALRPPFTVIVSYTGHRDPAEARHALAGFLTGANDLFMTPAP